MSKVVKGIKKAFRSVVKVVKRIWKPLVVAAAVYFTAGAAMSYFGAGAASGVAGAGAAGAAGAAGGGAAASAVVANAAAGMGATAAAAGTTLGGALAGTTTAAIASSAVAAGGAAVARGAFTRTAMGMSTGANPMAAATAATTTAPPAAAQTLGQRIGGAISSMSGYERAMYVQTLFSGVAGLMAPKPPTPDETASANARFRGTYFGVGEDGQQEFDPVATYNEYWKPQAGERYQGGMPDNRGAAPAAASPQLGATATAQANQQRPGQPRANVARQKAPPSFIEEDTNASGNAGFYGPDDFYS